MENCIRKDRLFSRVVLNYIYNQKTKPNQLKLFIRAIKNFVNNYNCKS